MDRILEQRLFVGQEVAYDDAGTTRRGYVERIDDSQVPAMVTVYRAHGCGGCRVTLPETAVFPSSALKMVTPRGAITRLAR